MTDGPTPCDRVPVSVSRSRLPLLGLLGVLAVVGGLSYLAAGGGSRNRLATFKEIAIGELPPEAAQAEDKDRIRAPELEGGVEWLNCGGPIRMKDLRGKVVLLDFWTLCCINCIHVMADLTRLEKKYPNQLVVIGVHSAKFNNEKDSKNIREAVLRYNIEHPVVNDADHKIWNAYAVRSWPTFWLIDPEGYLVGRGSGEGLFEALDQAIGNQIKTHREKKTLNEQPLRFDLAKFGERQHTPLYFPGKIVADAASQRLFIADSTHHRIVITDLDGRKIDVAGTGEDGKEDGSFDKATFNDPQGMALRGDTLFVADRKNHLLRALDLKTRTVKTVAGTGAQGHDRRFGGDAKSVGLNSPWDLWLQGDWLYIAMAGNHQIWRWSFQTNELTPYAGDGREDIIDSSLSRSAFAQPSGLTSDGEWLYVADSEVSAVRAVPLKPEKGDVKTLVGEGLFEFGDNDGVGDKARLQHCLAVAFHGGKVYVADTYNNKIKVIDPATRNCTTFLGDGKPGNEDQPARFDEPAGLSIAGGLLYVADTNNHLIRVVDLKTKGVRTLKLQGLEPPKPAKVADRPFFPDPVRTKLPPTVLAHDGDVTLHVKLEIPSGYKLNPAAPLQYLLETAADANAFEFVGKVDEPKTMFEIKVPASKLTGAKTLKVSLVYYPCQVGGEGVCQIKSHVWEIPVRLDAGSKERSIQLVAAIPAKGDGTKNQE